MGCLVFLSYFLPKSAGISPHSLVSHFRIRVVYVFSRSHFSARSISLNSSSVSAVRGSLVLHFFLPHPTDCIDAVTVNGHIESLLFQQSQSVYDSEEFADIIRSFRRAKVEDFLAAGYVDSAIFHRTGVAAAGSVHRQTVVNHAGGQCFRRNFLAFLLGVFSDIGVRGGGQCAFRFFAGVE